VEIDGSFHNDKIVQEGDRLRTVELEKMGYTIIRFTNKEVLQNVDSVIQKITCIVSSLMKQ
jgi:very-short-patch-repair endonuclease